MKGIIFNLLEEVVTQEHGADAWDGILDAAGADGAYTSLGNYPDAELMALVQAASAATQMPPNDVVRWFGRKSLPLLARSYPQFFTQHKTTRSFLLTLNDIIHPEVRKLYPGAETPMFHFETPAPDALTLRYVSKRRLCALAEGFIESTADHYGEEVSMRQTTCALRGDPDCLFELSFREGSGNGSAEAGASR